MRLIRSSTRTSMGCLGSRLIGVSVACCGCTLMGETSSAKTKAEPSVRREIDLRFMGVFWKGRGDLPLVASRKKATCQPDSWPYPCREGSYHPSFKDQRVWKNARVRELARPQRQLPPNQSHHISARASAPDWRVPLRTAHRA